jgi:hypothetical protein
VAPARFHEVSSLEHRDEAAVVARVRALRVADGRCQREQFVRDRKSSLERVGPPVRVVPALERVGERAGIAQATRHVDGLLGDALTRLGRERVAVRAAGKPREESRAQLAVLLGKGNECLLEQRHEPVVSPGPRPDEAAAVPERGAREVLREPRGTRRVGCTDEGLLRGGDITLSRLHVAEPQQELTRRSRVVDQTERLGVESGRFLVGEEQRSAIAGTGCVPHGRTRVRDRHRVAEVMGEFCEVRLRVALVQRLERRAHVAVVP